MKSRTIVISIMVLFSVIVGCDDDNLVSHDELSLEILMSEITELAESVNCSDSNNWTYTAIGSKPCGGPTGFLAYSLDIDIPNFLAKVEEHRIAQENINTKLGLGSDCSVPSQPDHIECSDGKAILVY